MLSHVAVGLVSGRKPSVKKVWSATEIPGAIPTVGLSDHRSLSCCVTSCSGDRPILNPRVWGCSLRSTDSTTGPSASISTSTVSSPPNRGEQDSELSARALSLHEVTPMEWMTTRPTHASGRGVPGRT